jgi:hypothetical protein
MSGERLQTGTGGDSISDHFRTVNCEIGKYSVKVVLTGANEFVGIAEVSQKTDFRSLRQKFAQTGVHDVEEFYSDDR